MTRKITDTLAAIASLVGLIALVAGVPIALYYFLGWPFQDWTRQDLSDLLNGRNLSPSNLALPIITTIAWPLWAYTAWIVITEVTATAKGAWTTRRRVLPFIQSFVGRLVATSTLLVAFLSRPAIASEAPLGPLPTIAQPEAEPTETVPPEADESLSVHTTQQGDTWWGLGETYLNAGERWQEIRDMNLGQRVETGTKISNSTEMLRPGWTLRVPNNTKAPIQADTTTVKPGDTLWSIAASTLKPTATDTAISERVNDIQEMNSSLVENPNLIYPNEELNIPAEQPTNQPIETTDQLETEEEQQTKFETEIAFQDPPENTTPSTATPESSPTNSTSTQNAETPAVTTAQAAASLVLGGVAILAFRNRNKTTMRRRPRNKTPKQIPNKKLETLQKLDSATRATEEIIGEIDPSAPASAEFLSTAMRALSGALHETEVTPRIRGAWITPDTIAVDFDSTSTWVEPVLPFAEYGNQQGWVIFHEDLGTAERLFDHGPDAPLPTLVTIGSVPTFEITHHLKDPAAYDTFGSRFLTYAANLENFPVTEIQGDPKTTKIYLEKMAAELGLSRCADGIDIVGIGVGEDLTSIERLRSVQTAKEILPAVDQVAANQPNTTALKARVSGHGADGFYPVVVFQSRDDDKAATEHLATTVSGSSGGLAYITANHVGHHASLRLRVENGQITAEELFEGLNFTESDIDPFDIGELFRPLPEDEEFVSTDKEFWDRDIDSELPVSEAIRSVKPTDFDWDTNPETTYWDDYQQDHEQTDPEPKRLEPPEIESAITINPETIDLTEKPTPAPEVETGIVVELLGPIMINGLPNATQKKSWKYSKVPELVAYLTLNKSKGGVPSGVLMEALFPGDPQRNQRLSQIASDARTAALGTDAEGNFYLPKVTDKKAPTYYVNTNVTSDIEIFNKLCKEAAKQESENQLENAATLWEEALRYVRGRPFTTEHDGWAWALGTIRTTTIKIEEIAAKLTDHSLANNNYGMALWASEQGLLTGSYNYDMLTLYGEAALASEDASAIIRAIFEIQTQADYHAGTPEEESSTLPPTLAKIYADLKHQRQATTNSERKPTE